MLRWALIFLVVALIAAVFGFGGIAAGAASIAKRRSCRQGLRGLNSPP